MRGRLEHYDRRSTQWNGSYRRTESLRFVGVATSMLGPRGRRWLSKKMGNDRVFLDFDRAARQGYEDRAQSATGVIEKK